MSVATTAPAPPPAKSFREVWVITLGHALTHWYPATFYLLLPLIGKELGLSYTQIGLVITCQYIAGAVSNVPGGMLVDTVGRKALLMAASLFWIGVPYLLMGFTHSYWPLLLCVALVGIGNNLWHPTAIPTLAQRFPERKGLVLSLHGMGGNAGDALAPIVVGSLLAAFSWREIVVINVIPGLLMALLILAYLGTISLSGRRNPNRRSLDEGHERQTLAQYVAGLKELARSRGLLLLTTGSAFRSMTQNALLTFIPVYLAYELDYSPFRVGVAMFVLQAAGFAAAPIAGHLSDRVGQRRVLAASMAMTAVIIIAMVVAGRTVGFVALIALLGFFLYAMRPVLQAWLLEMTPKNMGGTSIGVLFATQSLGAAAGPLIGGLIADRYGLLATFSFLAVTIIIANVFVLLMPKAPAVSH
jgi:MFS transporter, FSR family, fosmidomycin resistance protein